MRQNKRKSKHLEAAQQRLLQLDDVTQPLDDFSSHLRVLGARERVDHLEHVPESDEKGRVT